MRVADYENACVIEAMLFLKPEKHTYLSFISVRQVEISSRQGDQVLILFASLSVECDVMASDMHVVLKFFMCFLRTFATCLRSEKLRSP